MRECVRKSRRKRAREIIEKLRIKMREYALKRRRRVSEIID